MARRAVAMLVEDALRLGVGVLQRPDPQADRIGTT